MVLGQFEVEALPRDFAEPVPAHPLDVRFGDVIRLLGFDLAADATEVTLYWQAEQRMDASYKVFVHLMDPATGEIAAQVDAVPRQWTYPTNWWEEGEVVSDTIPLPSTQLPTGRFDLTVGLYHPESGIRLPVRLDQGLIVGDSLVLTEAHP